MTNEQTAKMEETRLCPLSGIGKPPSDWSACAYECALYDFEGCACSLHMGKHFQFLVEMLEGLL